MLKDKQNDKTLSDFLFKKYLTYKTNPLNIHLFILKKLSNDCKKKQTGVQSIDY